MAALAAITMSLAAAQHTRAAPPLPERVAFSWNRGPGADTCPGKEEIEQRVSALLGRDPFSVEAGRSIEASVERDADRWFVRIAVRDDQHLSAPRAIKSVAADCVALADASVLAIALAIDPEAALAAPPAPPVPASRAPPPPPASPPVSSSDNSSSPKNAPATSRGPGPAQAPLPPSGPSSRSRDSAVVVRGVATFGLVHAAAPGVALATSVDGGALEGTVGMLWIPEAASASGTFAFGLTVGWLGACVPTLRRSRSTLAVCGSVLGGAVHSVIREPGPYQPLQAGDRAWAAVSLAPRLRASVAGPVVVELGAEVIVPLTRYSFLVEGVPAAVFEQAPLAFAPFLGLGLSIF